MKVGRALDFNVFGGILNTSYTSELVSSVLKGLIQMMVEEARFSEHLHFPSPNPQPSILSLSSILERPFLLH